MNLGVTSGEKQGYGVCSDGYNERSAKPYVIDSNLERRQCGIECAYCVIGENSTGHCIAFEWYFHFHPVMICRVCLCVPYLKANQKASLPNKFYCVWRLCLTVTSSICKNPNFLLNLKEYNFLFRLRYVFPIRGHVLKLLVQTAALSILVVSLLCKTCITHHALQPSIYVHLQDLVKVTMYLDEHMWTCGCMWVFVLKFQKLTEEVHNHIIYTQAHLPLWSRGWGVLWEVYKPFHTFILADWSYRIHSWDTFDITDYFISWSKMNSTESDLFTSDG